MLQLEEIVGEQEQLVVLAWVRCASDLLLLVVGQVVVFDQLDLLHFSLCAPLDLQPVRLQVLQVLLHELASPMVV